MSALASLVAFGVAGAQATPAYNYVGPDACAECHKSESSGDQIGVWKKSKHADAYNSLVTARADSIAKSRGATGPAASTAECLGCHTLTGAGAEVAKLGVQCEACHGAGSAYQKLAVMKNKARSIAAGMTAYPDKAAIQAQCRSCHNEKSPTFKEFIFEERWEKIRHSRPVE